MRTDCFNTGRLGVLFLSVLSLCGCEDLVIRDTPSLLVPRLQRSEILGLVAGFGTTFAAVPDVVSMLKRRASAGMNPRMAGIMGVFQIAGSSPSLRPPSLASSYCLSEWLLLMRSGRSSGCGWSRIICSRRKPKHDFFQQMKIGRLK
jgi:hypothetical protein